MADEEEDKEEDKEEDEQESEWEEDDGAYDETHADMMEGVIAEGDGVKGKAK